MEHPFFHPFYYETPTYHPSYNGRAHYETPTYHPYHQNARYEIPTYHEYHDRAPLQPPTTTTKPYFINDREQVQPRKIIHFPVNYDYNKKRSESALKIQKTFRGFRVRKAVKKILEVKLEVDAVEKKLQDGEFMAVVKRDRMEKVKINEVLMRLLFKLDSIRGFDDGVREFRKGVIKKAIMLQELIDGDGDNYDNKENVDVSSTMFVKQDAILEKSEESDEDDEGEDDVTSNMENSSKIDDETEGKKADSCNVGEEGDHGGEEDHEGEGELVKRSSNDEWLVVDGGEEKERRDRLLERMAEDNKKLMAMVADLCEKSTAQTRMISSLANRVEQLEKVMSAKLMKKKKCNGFHS